MANKWSDASADIQEHYFIFILLSKDASVNMESFSNVYLSKAKCPLLARVIIYEPQHEINTEMGHSLPTLDYKNILIGILRV